MKIAAASIQTFSTGELKALTSTARQLGVKVVAHAHTWRAELLPENGGFDTIEHGNQVADDLVEVPKRCDWGPDSVCQLRTDAARLPGGRRDLAARSCAKALQRGVTKISPPSVLPRAPRPNPLLGDSMRTASASHRPSSSCPNSIRSPLDSPAPSPRLVPPTLAARERPATK